MGSSLVLHPISPLFYELLSTLLINAIKYRYHMSSMDKKSRIRTEAGHVCAVYIVYGE